MIYSTLVTVGLKLSIILPLVVSHRETVVSKIRSQYKPQYPVHLGDDGCFEDIFVGDLFVDKTLLIEKIMKSPHQVFLITGPKRIGKSVNMDMLSRFVEMIDCIHDEYAPESVEGTIFQRENTTAYEIFHHQMLKEKCKELETPLLISKDKEFMDKYQGRFPVVHIKLWSHAVCFETFVHGMIKYHIEQVCKRYEPILRMTYYHQIEANRSDYATREKLYKFERFREKSTVNETDLIESVQFLSKILKEHFKIPPIVIIDDYDFMPSRVLLDKYFEGRDEILNFYRKFFETTLKDRSLFTKLIISGTLKMKSVLMPGIKDIHDINLIEFNEFSPFYGFQRQEVDDIFNLSGVSKELKEKAYDYYNGYQIGNLEIYSPVPIIQCIRKNRVSDFWFDDVYNTDLFKKLLRHKVVRNEIFNLIHGHSREIYLENVDITEAEFLGLVTGASEDFNVGTTALKILTGMGYFAYQRISKDLDKIHLPNKEVRNTTRTSLIVNLREIPSLIPGYVWDVSDERQIEGEDKYFNSLSEELLKSFNNKDTSFPKIDALFEQNLKNASLKKLDKNKVLIHDVILYALLWIENHGKNNPPLNITVVDRALPEAHLPYIIVNYNTHGVLLEIKNKKGEILSKDFYTQCCKRFSFKTMKHMVIDVFRNKTTSVTAQYLYKWNR